MAGHEWYKQKSRYLDAYARGGFSPDIKEINAFGNRYDSHSYSTMYNVEGYFGNALYNYDERYFLQGKPIVATPPAASPRTTAGVTSGALVPPGSSQRKSSSRTSTPTGSTTSSSSSLSDSRVMTVSVTSSM